MSDETELNPKMSGEQSAIEAALFGVGPRESAIDHDSVMYQAGWAAAMAECTGSDVELRRDAAATKIWPALAMTFAASTVACLLFIWLPSRDEARIADNQNSVAVVEESVEQSPVTVAQNRNVIQQATVKNAVATTSPRLGLLQGLLSSTANRMVAQRDAQLEKYISEAVSPSQVSIGSTDADWEGELSDPLTPRSKFVF
jgi:hypothetical protein